MRQLPPLAPLRGQPRPPVASAREGARAAWPCASPALVRCLTAALVAVSLVGCGAASLSSPPSPSSPSAPGKAALGSRPAAPRSAVAGVGHRSFLWSYHGRYDPAHWGERYCLCRGGRRQSPVDLRADRHVVGRGDEVVARTLHVRHVLNNGHTVQIGVDHVETLFVRGRAYRLLQLHFHTPAEHTTGGVRAPMELHLVHRSAQGDVAVVSVLFQVGPESPWLARLWRDLPSKSGQVVAEDVTLPVREVVGAWRGAWVYEGSLTTPPCTEGVHWLVLKGRQTASAAQIAGIHKLLGDNARPLQSRGARHITDER